MEKDLRAMASFLAAQNEPNGVTALIILRQAEDVTTEITESTEEMLEDREQATGMPCCQATSIAGGEQSNLKREAEKSRNEPNRKAMLTD